MLQGALSTLFSVHPNPGTGASALPNGAEIRVLDRRIFNVTRPSDSFLRSQMRWLRAYADLRYDRAHEINVQIGDILSFFGMTGHLNNSMRKYTLELLTVAQMVTIGVELQAKHFCWSPRPIHFSDQVQPIIQTPDHSTFPSGHATEAFVIATILSRLAYGQPAHDALAAWQPPFRVAHRIATNRTIAGVHFPADNAAGALLGCMIGEAIYAFATGPSVPVFRAEFDLAAGPALGFDEDADLTADWLRGLAPFASEGNPIFSDPILADFWALAAGEWA